MNQLANADSPDCLSPMRSWLALVWLLGFVWLFFSQSLPIADVSRIGFVWRAPFSMLDVIDPPEIENLSTIFENPVQPGFHTLPSRWDLILVFALIWGAIWGWGRTVLTGLITATWDLNRAECFLFASACGVAVVTFATLGTGLAGWGDPWFLIPFLSLGIVCGLTCEFRVHQNQTSNKNHADGGAISFRMPIYGMSCLVVIVPIVLLMALASMIPPIEFDAREYHLQGPKEYFLAGKIDYLPHNVYTCFPFLTEMLTFLAMTVCGEWFRGALAGQFVLMGFAPLTALGIFCLCRRWHSDVAGWLGSLAYLTQPWTWQISTIPFAEGGLSFFVMATCLACVIAVSTERSKTTGERNKATGTWFLVGLCSGCAFGCKYPGIIWAVIPAMVVIGIRTKLAVQSAPNDQTDGKMQSLWMHRSLVFLMGLVLTTGPWLLKNTLQTGNPVYPLLWSVFGGSDWDAELHERWRNGHRPDGYEIDSLFRHAGQIVLTGNWLSPLLFGFAPLTLLLFWRDVRVRWLWIYVAGYFLLWWWLTHRIDRFWLPVVPVLCVLAGMATATLCRGPQKRVVVAVLILSVVYSYGLVTSPLMTYAPHLADLETERQRAEYANSPALFHLNRQLAVDDAKVLFVGDAALFEVRFPYAYNTVFNHSLLERYTSSGIDTNGEFRLLDRNEILLNLEEEGFTHVVVNWREIRRYLNTYGFSEFVTRDRLRQLVDLGVLHEPERIADATESEIYRINIGQSVGN